MAVREIHGVIKLKDEASASIKKMTSSLNDALHAATEMHTVLQAVGGYESAKKIIEFGKEIFTLASNEEALSLQVKNMADKDYPMLAESIDRAVEASHGLAIEGDLNRAATAAVEMGASVGFVAKNLKSVQELSAVAGKDMSAIMEKLTGYAEYGTAKMLKGVPILNRHFVELKRLSTITGEYGKQVREAAITRIFSEEQNNLAQKFNEYLKTSKGATEIFSKQLENIKIIWGKLLVQVLTPFIFIADKILIWLTKTPQHIAWLKTGLLLLSFVMGGVLIVAVYSLISAFSGLAIAVLAATWPIVVVAVALTALYLIIEDIYYYLTGGNSQIGELIPKWEKWGSKNKVLAQSFKVLMAPFVATIACVIAIIALVKNWDTISQGLKDTWASVGSIFMSIIGWMQDKFEAFVSWFKDLPDKIRAAVIDIKGSIGNFGSKTLSVMTGGGTPEGHAAGGSVSAGKPYIVGEQGPELFSPGSSGSITPNNKLGGSTVHIGSIVGNMTFNVSGPAQAAQSVKDAVMNALDELGRGQLRTQLGMRTM